MLFEEVCKRMSGKLIAATESSAVQLLLLLLLLIPLQQACTLENQHVHETVNFVVRNEQTGEEVVLINPSLF